MSKTVLCVEDNIKVQMITKPMLEAEGFMVTPAMNLSEARAAVKKEMPDLIILDIHLPDGNGLDFLKELRRNSNVPVIALANSYEEQDIIDGFASGCDDYIPKPYTFPVLCARIEAILRRTEHQFPKTVKKNGFTFNIISGTALFNGRDLGVTQKEYELLYFLMQNENVVLSPDEIYEQVWGLKMIGDKKALKNVIYDLRENLQGTGHEINSVYGKGYIFEKVK